MENYIKSKGLQPIGPLIQYTGIELNENQEPELKLKLMRQASNFIHTVDKPYDMQSVVRVKDCLYARFIGEEDKVKVAYDKLNVKAYEEEIPLSGSTYTIFVSNENDEMVADVFMEKAKDE